MFTFQWQEVDGPPVAPPSRKGFGSRMIERALASYFDGKAQIVYEPTGVILTLRAQLAALTAD